VVAKLSDVNRNQYTRRLKLLPSSSYSELLYIRCVYTHQYSDNFLAYLRIFAGAKIFTKVRQIFHKTPACFQLTFCWKYRSSFRLPLV